MSWRYIFGFIGSNGAKAAMRDVQTIAQKLPSQLELWVVGTRDEELVKEVKQTRALLIEDFDMLEQHLNRLGPLRSIGLYYEKAPRIVRSHSWRPWRSWRFLFFLLPAGGGTRSPSPCGIFWFKMAETMIKVPTQVYLCGNQDFTNAPCDSIGLRVESI
jgi:hypothetical protein